MLSVMKKCFIMFAFFVVMLIIAAITDKSEAMISERNVNGYADAEMLLVNEEPIINDRTE